MSSGRERFLHPRVFRGKRPLGITGLSIFFAAGTLPSAFSALAIAFPGEWAKAIWRLKPEAQLDFARLGGGAIPLMTMVAVSCAATAGGLWFRRRWGHRLAVGLLSVNLVGDLLNSVLQGTGGP